MKEAIKLRPMNEIDPGVMSYPEGKPKGEEEKPFVITYKSGKKLEGMASEMDNEEWKKVLTKGTQ